MTVACHGHCHCEYKKSNHHCCLLPVVVASFPNVAPIFLQSPVLQIRSTHLPRTLLRRILQNCLLYCPVRCFYAKCYPTMPYYYSSPQKPCSQSCLLFVLSQVCYAPFKWSVPAQIPINPPDLFCYPNRNYRLMLSLHALLYYSSTQSPWSQSCVLFVMLLSHHLFKLKSQTPLATNPPSLFATQIGHALLFKWKPLLSILHTLLSLQVCYPPFTCELFKLESQTPLVKNPPNSLLPKNENRNLYLMLYLHGPAPQSLDALRSLWCSFHIWSVEAPNPTRTSDKSTETL